MYIISKVHFFFSTQVVKSLPRYNLEELGTREKQSSIYYQINAFSNCSICSAAMLTTI